jgi:hypothetical protein
MTMLPCIGTSEMVAARADETPHVTATAAAAFKRNLFVCMETDSVFGLKRVQTQWQ